jgi:hypothetical protein
MSYYTARDISLVLNNNTIFCNQLNLSQQASLSHPIQEGEVVSTRNVANSAMVNELNFQYYITGRDYLYDFLLTNHKNSLSGTIAGIRFNQGYIKSYSLNGEANSPLIINAQLAILDELSGSFVANSPSAPIPNLQVFNFNDSYFTLNNNYSVSQLDNITNFSWNFSNNVTPVYYYQQTGASYLNPDRVVIAEKEISCEITCDDTNIPMHFSGERLALDFTCRNPAQTASQTFSISGLINKKDFSVSTDNLSQSVYSITQQHLNEFPAIGSVTTSTYPSLGYIIIQSPNLTNGFFSNTNNFPLVEKVILGDRELNFAVNRGASFDTITGFIPLDAINGNLSVVTTKGLILYPTQINLNFSGIGVSGFYPETGNYHDTILISGSNFNRVSQVLFNNVSANFNVYDNTGIYNKLIASVPDGITVGKINIVSSLRNVSGSSTGIFYPIPEITGFTPTGMWGGQAIIAGKNFSGITNVYFNNIRVPNFTVNNSQRITATIPNTGAGYTKGYIKVSGYKGMEGISKSIYYPMVRISGISTISGGIDNDLKITGLFDIDFLSTGAGTGVKVAFGDVSTYFYRSGNINNYVLTGLIPNGFFDNQYISLYEPDGISKYPPFTQRFEQVGPPPVITSINGQTYFEMKPYSTQTLAFGGLYFKDFFALSSYVMISGMNDRYNYSNIQFNSLGNQLIVPNVKITGSTGLYDIYVMNYAGTGRMKAFSGIVNSVNLRSGIQVTTAVDMAKTLGTAVIFPTITGYQTDTSINGFSKFYVSTNDGTQSAVRAVSNVVDNNNTSFCCSAPFPVAAAFSINQPITNSGYCTVTFNNPITLNSIIVKQGTNIPVSNSSSSVRFKISTRGIRDYTPDVHELAQTGMFDVFDNGNRIIYSTGVNFNNQTHILTGELPNVKMIKLSRIGNSSELRFLGFSSIEAY